MVWWWFRRILGEWGRTNDFLSWDPRAASLRPAERHNTQGFSTPFRVLNHGSCLRLSVKLLWRTYSCYSSCHAPCGLEVGLRISRRGPGGIGYVWGLGAPSWPMLVHFLSIFRVLGASGASWVRSCVWCTIFSDFATTSQGFGKVWERFWGGFRIDFLRFYRKCRRNNPPPQLKSKSK